jgi:hypothetical protein
MLPARNPGPPPHLARATAPAKNLILRHEKLDFTLVLIKCYSYRPCCVFFTNKRTHAKTYTRHTLITIFCMSGWAKDPEATERLCEDADACRAFGCTATGSFAPGRAFACSSLWMTFSIKINMPPTCRTTPHLAQASAPTRNYVLHLENYWMCNNRSSLILTSMALEARFLKAY